MMLASFLVDLDREGERSGKAPNRVIEYETPIEYLP